METPRKKDINQLNMDDKEQTNEECSQNEASDANELRKELEHASERHELYATKDIETMEASDANELRKELEHANERHELYATKDIDTMEASDVNELRKELEHANERLKQYAVKDIETMERVAKNETTIEELNHQIVTLKDNMLKYDFYGKNWQLEKVKSDYRELEKLRERQFKKARNDLMEQMDRDRQAFNLEKKEMIRSKKELLTRLSKLAGSRLTQNNPGITDLSDSNRESKIAEQFIELYDTEWTDAFEELMESGLKENEVIYVILDIVKTAYGFCCKLAEKYKAGIFESPSQLPVLGVIQQSDPDMKVNPEIKLSDEITFQLEDIRKALSPLFCESVEKIFLCILRDTLPKSITTAKGGSTDVDMKKNTEKPLSDELASENKDKKGNKENSGNNDVTYNTDGNGITTQDDNNGTFIAIERTKDHENQVKDRYNEGNSYLDGVTDTKDEKSTSHSSEVEGYDSSTVPNNEHISSNRKSDTDQEGTNGQSDNDEQSSEHGNVDRSGQQIKITAITLSEPSEAAEFDEQNNEEEINAQQDGKHGTTEKDETKIRETEVDNEHNNIEIDAAKRENKEPEETQKSNLDEADQQNIKEEESQQNSVQDKSENLKTDEPQNDNYDTGGQQYSDEDDRHVCTEIKETQKKNKETDVPKGNRVTDGQQDNVEDGNSDIETDEKRNKETDYGNGHEDANGQQNNTETDVEAEELPRDSMETDGQRRNKEVDGQQEIAAEDVRCYNVEAEESQNDNIEADGQKSNNKVDGQKNSIETGDIRDKIVNVETPKGNINTDGQKRNKEIDGQHENAEYVRCDNVEAEEPQKDNLEEDGQKSNKQADNQQDSVETGDRRDKIVNDETQKDNIEANGQEDKREGNGQHTNEGAIKQDNKKEGTINSETQMQSMEDGSEDNEKSGSNNSMTMDSTTLNKQAKGFLEEKSDSIEDIKDLFKNDQNIELNDKQINNTDIQGNENVKRGEITDLFVGNGESAHRNFKTGKVEKDTDIPEDENLVGRGNDGRDGDIEKSSAPFHDIENKCISLKMEESFDINSYSKTCVFASKCARLCWLMRIKDPPLQLIWECTRGSKFNSDAFRHYTRSGKKTDFVVWPALLLHENGPLLGKGVAQAI